MTHLWEVAHPFYGSDGGGGEKLDSFQELQEMLAGPGHSPGSTVIYRWDWLGPHSPDAEPDDPEELVVFGFYPRTSACWSVSCPISKDQEAEVREWLAGPDVLGRVVVLWSPLLDDLTPSGSPDRREGPE